jgi:serine/threonine protein kinase
MGNQQTVTTKGERGGSLHGNLIAEDRKLEDKYAMSAGEALGTGNCTQIKKAELKNYTKTNRGAGVAIKLYDGKSDVEPDLKKEAKILSQCDHPNIVKLYEVTKVNNRISLVLELCDGGNVLTRLPYTEAEASRIVKQVTSAIAYMHGKNMMHRDVDCSNILYASAAEDSEVKLVDFGSACDLELVPGHAGAFKFLHEKTGSLRVMAPEVARGKYGPKADVWSIGVVAFTLINNGEEPIKGATK